MKKGIDMICECGRHMDDHDLRDYKCDYRTMNVCGCGNRVNDYDFNNECCDDAHEILMTNYFWNYKYRYWMRGDAHGNGYKGLPIEHARKIILRLFLAEGLDLAGDTEQHDEIINLVFGMNEYQQERN